jgi:hypothetical protein
MKTNNLTVSEQYAMSELLCRVPIEIMFLTIIHVNMTFTINYRLSLVPGERRKQYAGAYVRYLTRHIADNIDLVDYSKEIGHIRELFEIEK